MSPLCRRLPRPRVPRLLGAFPLSSASPSRSPPTSVSPHGPQKVRSLLLHLVLLRRPPRGQHPEFAAFLAGLHAHFELWRIGAADTLRRAVARDSHPKRIIHDLSENLLAHYEGRPLLDAYAVYQHLMDYWAATMQDDCYLVAADGWVARTARIVETAKNGKTKDRGWTSDLVPKGLVVARYFAAEQAALDARQAELEATTARLAELEEEHGGEDGCLGALDKIAKPEINARLKELKGGAHSPNAPGSESGQLAPRVDRARSPNALSDSEADEAAILRTWLRLADEETALKKAIREADAALDLAAYQKYPTLTEAEVQTLVVDDKWLATLGTAVRGEVERVSQTLTSRIRTLADRYATPLAELEAEVATLAARVDAHLKKMESAAS